MELPTPQAVHTALEMKTGHDRFAKAHEAAYLIAWAYADGLLVEAAEFREVTIPHIVTAALKKADLLEVDDEAT